MRRMMLIVVLGAPLALAQEDVDTRRVFRAKRGTIHVGLERPGRLVPADAAEISLELEAYGGDLRVLEVKTHGSTVSEGEVLMRFDTRAIERQLRQARLDLALAEQTYKNEEQESALNHEAEAEKAAAAERALSRARRALEGFLLHEKAHRDERKRLDREAWQHRQDDQKDELVQLEKMYTEDELVDATEEIVLKRSRRNLKRTVANNALRDKIRAYGDEYKEPLRQEDLEIAVEQKTASLDRLLRGQAIARLRREAGLKRSDFALQNRRTHLARLERDLAKLDVRASRAGLLLHGAPEDEPGAMRLKRGGKVKTWQVFLSVADPGRLKALSSVTEEDILNVTSGLEAAVVPKARADLLPGRIEVAYMPGAHQKYRVDVPLKMAESDLRPGMQCTVWIRLPEERDGVLLPLDCFGGSVDAGKAKLTVLREGKQEEVEILVGVSDGVQVLIEEGLEEGDRVLETEDK